MHQLAPNTTKKKLLPSRVLPPFLRQQRTINNEQGSTTQFLHLLLTTQEEQENATSPEVGLHPGTRSPQKAYRSAPREQPRCTGRPGQEETDRLVHACSPPTRPSLIIPRLARATSSCSRASPPGPPPPRRLPGLSPGEIRIRGPGGCRRGGSLLGGRHQCRPGAGRRSRASADTWTCPPSAGTRW